MLVFCKWEDKQSFDSQNNWQPPNHIIKQSDPTVENAHFYYTLSCEYKCITNEELKGMPFLWYVWLALLGTTDRSLWPITQYLLDSDEWRAGYNDDNDNPKVRAIYWGLSNLRITSSIGTFCYLCKQCLAHWNL